MEKWEESMALDLEWSSHKDVLFGLLVKDLLNGGAYDVEVEEPAVSFSADYLCGDELEDDVYRLLIVAEVEGPENHDLIRQFTEELLEELMEEARQLAEGAEDLGSVGHAKVIFQPVPEDDERWDLIVPDWLAPDGAEVPFGFRPYLAADQRPWPGDDVLDAHGRVVIVPFSDELHLFGTPMSEEAEATEEANTGGEPS